ncbi:hypothetical protein PRUPE_5G180400 [Prunus persica]|uniref:Uncharacterized protein n=1 Tax=Prunus persica TaxID=3760 RepID=M5W9Q0_PRUPE|nr:pre-mRNA-splicing factor 38B [Prunus persica]ONI08480.1 hypothetical protein PRUPE_5G180400 [Prunus persica]
MEEAKAAAYYEELTRRGEGAARFKQGLGFSSASTDSENPPTRGSALPYSSSSFLSKFVKASSPKKESELQKQAQIESIQNKLKRKKSDLAEEEEEKQPPRVSHRESKHSRKRSRSRSRERHSRRRSRSRERHRDRDRERERDRDRDRDRDRERRRRRSRSGSDSDGGRRRRGRSRSRSRSPRDRRKERRSRSSSPRERDLEKSKGKMGKERNGAADYSKLIQGYDKMSAAERVKAKMKFQLAETAEKDMTKGMGSGWERFEFNKDAPLDDEEVEVAEDDAALVKHIGRSFRFSAIENKREEKIKTAHDEAMFGSSDNPPSIMIDSEVEAENDIRDSKESEPTSLLSDKVLAKKQGSWRDRIRDKRN